MLVNEMDKPPARTLGLMGAKGGVGTTLLTTSLAWALAQRGLQVVVLDLDRSRGQAALHLCEDNAGPTLREALQVIDRLDDTLLDTLLTPCGPNLRMLPAPRQWLAPAFEPPCTNAHLQKLTTTATSLADWVLLDLPSDALTNTDTAPIVAELDELVLVSEPSLPATFNARRAWARLLEMRPEHDGVTQHHTRFVLNKVPPDPPLSSEQIRRTVGLESNGHAWRELPRSDELVAQATYQGQAVGALDARAALSRALSQWAAQCVGSVDGDSSVTEGPSWRERLQRWAS